MTDLLNLMLSGINSEKSETLNFYKRKQMIDKITSLPKFENNSWRLRRAHEQARRIQILSSL